MLAWKWNLFFFFSWGVNIISVYIWVVQAATQTCCSLCVMCDSVRVVSELLTALVCKCAEGCCPSSYVCKYACMHVCFWEIRYFARIDLSRHARLRAGEQRATRTLTPPPPHMHTCTLTHSFQCSRQSATSDRALRAVSSWCECVSLLSAEKRSNLVLLACCHGYTVSPVVLVL